MTAWAPGLRERFAAAREIEILTGAANEHHAIIWVVVDPLGRALVRSVNGPAARWYREARAYPDPVIRLDGEVIAVRAEPAIDDERIAACSDALRAKYGNSSSVASMLREHTLATTLELVPR